MCIYIYIYIYVYIYIYTYSRFLKEVHVQRRVLHVEQDGADAGVVGRGVAVA